ncbi:MAG: restriction endonuclease subunit S [Rhodanobacteraceae bacterium]
MSKWALVPLGDVMATHIDAVPTADLRMVNLAGVYGFGRGLFKRGQTSPMETTYKAFHRLNGGDFVISSPKAWEGAVSRIPEEFDGWFLSPVFPTFHANSDRLDTRYLNWYCKRPAVWHQLHDRSKGMGARRESVSPTQFLSLRIPLPPLAEQQAIVARLDALADGTRQLSEHLDAIEADAAAFVLSIHHKLADGREVALSDMIELYEEAERICPDREYPQVGVRSFGGGLFAKAPVAAIATSYRAFNTLFQGALVLSQVKGWEGAIALTPPSLIGRFASPEYRTFRCIEGEASADYLGELVKTPWFWSLLQDATRGVGARRERTRPEQFLNIALPMPKYTDQCKAVRMFSRMNTLKTHHAALREANGALLPATLERLFA